MLLSSQHPTIPSVTTSKQSCLLNFPLDDVWELLRPCAFVWQESIVTKSELRTKDTRLIHYKDKTQQTIQLTEISHKNYKLCWSMIVSEPPVTYTSRDDTICLTNITAVSQADESRGIKDQTFIEWETEFSNDVTTEVIIDANLKKCDGFIDLKGILTRQCDLLKRARSEDEMLGKWIVGETLGSGAFANVKLALHSQTMEYVALKILKVKPGTSDFFFESIQVKQEIASLKKIDHPNVIKLKGFNFDLMYHGEKVIFVVLEFAAGGELFEYLAVTGAFEDGPVSRSYFRQLMSGIQAAHLAGICHRDIKAENILMDKHFQLKIADFGLAAFMKGQKKISGSVGTEQYKAPELFTSKDYDGTLVDIWACGVVLFLMIAGHPPYEKNTDWWFRRLLQRKYAKFWMAHCRTVYFTEEGKDLFNRIFAPNPDNRISVDAIMQHPWYQGPILEADALRRRMAQRKLVIDQENRMLNEQKAQRGGEGFMEDNERGFGDGTTHEDSDSDDLPDGGPRSIVLVLNSKNIKDIRESDDGDFGIRDSSDGIPGETKMKKEDAPIYNPVKMRFTKFNCSESPQIIFSELKSVLESLTIKYDTEKYTFTAQAPTISENVNFVIKIFRHFEDSDVSIVEFHRGKGDSRAFLNFYARIRNKMEPFVFKKSIANAENTENKELISTDDS